VLVAHHFAVDGMSWRILFEDLSRAYRCALDRRPIELPEVPTPFTGWVHALRAFAGNDEVRREREHWVSTLRTATQPLPDCPPVRDCGRFGDTCTESVHLDAEPTGQLLRDANRAYRTTTEELVLAALARALAAWHGGARTLVALEGHGREPLDAGVDASRTVGWLTSLYPIVLELAEGRDLAYQIKHVKETLRKVPRAGIGYGLLRYALNDDAGADPDLQREPEVSFNYFGRFDAGLGDGLSLADPGIAGRSVSDDAARGFELELVGVVIADRLTLSAHFATERVRATGPRKLLDHWCAALEAIIAHCVAQGRSELTPSDLSYRDLSLDELEDLIS
jgi:non-ribosomal peptide synthase protein (TIGR01720 family)